MTSIIIREASLEDLDKLAPLFDSYRVFYRKPSNISAGKEFLKQRILQKESVIYVGVFNSELVGFTQLYPIFSSTRMKRVWLLNDLFVNLDYRGNGISVALIEKAKELCANTNGCGIILETEASNTIGNNLYPKTGFKLSPDNFYEWDL